MADPAGVARLVADTIAGDRGTVARLISLVESGAPEAVDVVAALYPRTGRR